MSLLSSLYNLAVLGRLGDDPGPFDPAQVKKILVVRNDNIGDVICTTPALDALRQAFPQAYIAAVVCTLAEEALSGHRALDRLWAYPKAKHKQHGALKSLALLGQVLRQVRQERFDLVIAPRVSFSTSQGWIAYASAARWRLGVAAQGKRARWGFYYNLPAPQPGPGLHEVERCFHLLSHIRVDSPDKRLYLKVPQAAALRAREFLAGHGLDQKPGPVVVNITRWAYRPDRLWPAENYRALVEALAGRPGGVVVTHAPADEQWVLQVLDGLAVPVYWSQSLKEFAALLARGRAVLTAEGGPMHLAAALGRPLVVLWGRTPIEVWHPWGVDHRIVGGHGPVSQVSPAQMLAALEDLLAAQPAPAGRAAQSDVGSGS
ncbi:MAG: glycosyltransferase family 9 protein [Desulfarculus sp.]|nr:glycosyltransferase family 9 protein [Desulfarculus sp.]